VGTQLFFLEISQEILWKLEKYALPLQRYPENNLFTLKRTNTY
jgi:hypothetical protein